MPSVRKFIKIYKFKGNSHDTFFVIFFALLDVLMPVKIWLIEANFVSRTLTTRYCLERARAFEGDNRSAQFPLKFAFNKTTPRFGNVSHNHGTCRQLS